MAGIKHLKQVRDKKGDDFLNNLLNNFVIINENIEGTFFGVKKDKSGRFKYFKKSGEITYVDRMLMKYYNPAIAYFEKLSDDKKSRIPSNFYFGFEYVTSRDSKSSNFKTMPKNNLVLSYIHRLNEDGKPEETLQTKDDLDRWAYYLEVESPPIIFEGKLDDEQKTSILEFAYSSPGELEEKFKTTSFTKYLISILNPDADLSNLRKGRADDMDGIIFRFYDENDENAKANAFLAKLVDPMFSKKGKEVKSENKSNDYIWLIVIDLMNRIEIYNEDQLRKMCEGEDDENYDAKYLKLINSVFKDFIADYSYKYDGIQLETPEYLKRPEFEIELDLINDPDVVNLIKGNETYKEIYRILVNFFRKTRRKTSSSFFSSDMLAQLNIQIKKIKRVIVGDVLYEGLFPSFGEFTGDSEYDSVFIGEHENFTKKNKGKVKTENVNVLIGRFQPVHNGHIKAAEKLMAKNGNLVVLVAVVKKNKRYPFSERSVRIMLEKVQQENPDLIKEVRIVDRDSINGILASLKPDFNPILWGSSHRKIKDYVLQLDHIKKKNVPIRLANEFKLIEIPSYHQSEDILMFIEKSDYASFKKVVPKSISSEFFNLQKELELFEK
jgi:cytidyltransferase-like protein